MTTYRITALLLCGSLLALSACAQPASTAVATTPSVAKSNAVSPAAQPSLPLVHVHKSPTCGCCIVWIEHLKQAGFTVEVSDMDDVSPVKERLGVPFGKGSCHTAEVAGYFVEGHVPAQDIKRLLAEKPDAKGLVVPGMPLGSPGMEVPDGRKDAYTVELVGRDGSSSAYAQYE